MQQQRRPFGAMPDGTPVEEITLARGPVTCQIITYGGGDPDPDRPRPGRETGGCGAGL